MSRPQDKFTLGLDFGTESGRVMLVHAATGEEAAWSVIPYPRGVIDRCLPNGTPLGPDWALQDPRDYLEVLRKGIPTVLRQAGASPDQVAGVGVDFTSCTMLPVRADGTPLCTLPAFAGNPHAWVKLWKHHAAQRQAERINQLAAEFPGDVLAQYSRRYSSEWLIAKILQIAEEAPEIYDAADRILEAADWLVWQLTGAEVRSECMAGYKGLWTKGQGWAPPAFFEALHPGMGNLVAEKLGDRHRPLGARAGGLSARMAHETGLNPGTPVAVACIDAHAGVPACGVVKPGAMVMIMGTSLCHMLLGAERHIVEGVAGVVEDGIVPGAWGYEAGQAAVGDLYAWFFRTFKVKPEEATLKAAALRPGQTGLLGLDWWNGNRSVLMNASLSGLLAGMTLATEAHEIYRALIESSAFGTLTIIQAFERKSIPVTQLVACGGLAQNSPLVLQIFADVSNRRIQLPRSLQASGLGAAMHAAIAAGIYSGFEEAAAAMTGLQTHAYDPDPAAHEVYRRLYSEYETLHDYFGRGGNDAMRRLRSIASEITSPPERRSLR